MTKIIEYKIVEGNDCNKIEGEVNELLKQGFMPLGGISSSFVPNEEKIHTFQALVKMGETKSPI
jgi:hypothetical protein